MHRLLAERRPLRGSRPGIADVVQEIVDSNKHVEHRMALAAKRGFLFQPVLLGLEVGEIEATRVDGAGELLQYLNRLFS